MPDYPQSSADFTKAEMAGKYLWQQAANGTSATIEQCLQEARLLRLVGEDPHKGPEIKWPTELLSYVKKLGSFNGNNIAKRAVNLANLIITDIRRAKNEPSKIPYYLAPQKRKDLWQKLHLMPGGANAEINFAQKNCFANQETYQSLLGAIRLGIINHYNGHLSLYIIRKLLADISSEPTNNQEPLIRASRLIKGEVQGIIININGSADNTKKREVHPLALDLASDNILIKEVSEEDLGKVIESAVNVAEELNIDTSQLPLVIRILNFPQEKAIADYCTLLAFGWPVHISPLPEITADRLVLKNINDILDNLSLGKIIVEKDLQKTLRLYKDYIEKKRASLGLS